MGSVCVTEPVADRLPGCTTDAVTCPLDIPEIDVFCKSWNTDLNQAAFDGILTTHIILLVFRITL